MYKIKQIKRYKLNTFKKEELKQILNKLHFRNGSFQSKYKINKWLVHFLVKMINK